MIKIDFILSKDSEFQRSTFSRRKRITIGHQALWLISPEDLILAKLLWAKESFSELQLNDIRSLWESVQDLDRTYIHGWVTKLGCGKIFEKV